MLYDNGVNKWYFMRLLNIALNSDMLYDNGVIVVFKMLLIIVVNKLIRWF